MESWSIVYPIYIEYNHKFVIKVWLFASFSEAPYNRSIEFSYLWAIINNKLNPMDYLFPEKNAPLILSRQLRQLIETIGETKTK